MSTNGIIAGVDECIIKIEVYITTDSEFMTQYLIPKQQGYVHEK